MTSMSHKKTRNGRMDETWMENSFRIYCTMHHSLPEANQTTKMLPFRKTKRIHTRFFQRYLLFACYCLALSHSSSSQEIIRSSDAAFAEIIYLQLGNKVYTTDQTIWFKAIIANASDHTPSGLSGVLYAELIDAHENIIEKKLIKISNGTGDGFFQLTPAYTHGVYQVRAYTEWNRNFGADFFFTTYLLIAGPDGKKEINPIWNVTVTETVQREKILQVQIMPESNQRITEKPAVFLLLPRGRRDTLSLAANKSKQSILESVIPAETEMLTIQVEADDESNFSKTIVIDTTHLDLQFFPESGELVQGLPTVMGFKALHYSGKGILVEGQIINAKGEIVAPFKSNPIGMGSVYLPFADSYAGYSAVIFSNGDSTIQKKYSLPPIAIKGNNLSVSKKDDKILLKARSNYLVSDSILIRASCRGVIYFDFRGKLNNGLLEFALPANLLPEGIIDFTLFTNAAIPVAERLYFNEKQESRINIAVATEKQEFAPREQTAISIETKNASGEPVPANLSLLVFNKSREIPDYRQNILSYFLLTSDLKGEIENPGFYFSNDSSRLKELDALLLTQGWRKYNYSRDSIAFRFKPEPSLAVSGTVFGGLSDKKIIREAELTMMTFGSIASFDNQKTDNLGRFNFPINDEYGQHLNVLIQSASKSNKKRNYLIKIDKKESPPVYFNPIRSVEKPDSIINEYVKESLRQKRVIDSFLSATEGITLGEVVVKSTILSPEQKKMTERFGEAKEVIKGEEIRDKEARWSYGLYSVLLFNFPDKVRIIRAGNGVLYARLHNGNPTLVVIDGIPVQRYEYELIPGIPPSEVKSFELIENAKGFMSLFCEVFPDLCKNAPALGNVIAIYTYAGKGVHGIKATVGMTKASVPVFSPSREYYTPRYDQSNPADSLKPDLRNLVYWNPRINTTNTGKTSVFFYNPDNTGDMQVVIEAITENGEIGYQELLYKVKKNK